MNKLFYGDNLEVLRKYIADETVDLCYIDPPFNSKRNYNQIYNNVGKEDKAQAQAFLDTWTWDDAAENGLSEIMGNFNGVYSGKVIDLIDGLKKILSKGSLLAYLVSMTQRIAEIYRVLKPTGSFYLHCDPTASHYLKLILDAVFCSQKGEFQNEIIWRRTGQHNKVTRFGPIHDVIFFYTKTEIYTWNRPKKPYMVGHVQENFVKDADGYRTNYYGNVLTGSGTRNGESGMEWRGFNPTAKGRHWAIPGALLEDIDEDISELSQHEKLEYFYKNGQIKIVEGQAWPIYERRIKQTDGQAISDIWSYQPYTKGTVFGTNDCIDEDVRWLSPKDKERLGYPTQKPEGLLERIIRATSNEGDVVLDAYCGCGTSIAVAERLKRKWIGIDITYQSVSLILRRLEETFGKKVLDNVDLNGTPRDINAAKALANKEDDRTRKEFEKWSVLTYSENKAVINEKKGADKGIDGIAYILDTSDSYKKVIFSVKSGHITPAYVRDLRGVVEREEAVMGVLITLEVPTKKITEEAKIAGKYENKLTGLVFDKIKVVTVEEIVNGERLKIPMSVEVLKKAVAKGKSNQNGLF